ncbi:MAG TPA: penicillin-binding protein 2 [Alphaproteobacteria bacterium]|nr:penicillin-binding protein 2 [Alphaproteobacteria bacterium]
MQLDQFQSKQFGRRAAIIVGGQVVLLSALVARMYYLQVLQSEKYQTLAEDNRINLRLLPPPRGRILDRFGVPVALNRQNYRVVIVPEDAGDLAATLDRLARVIPLADAERRRVLRDAERKRAFVPITVRENLSWEEFARVEVNTPDLSGVRTEVGRSRFYPYGPTFAHMVGYVAVASDKELDGDPLLELPDFRIGKAGVEKVYDLALRGSAGTSQVEVNARGRVIRELARDEGDPGKDVTLSVDFGLQQFLTQRIANERSAAAVLMDPHTGEVLAMASTPSFEPNEFNEGLSSTRWQALTGDPLSPLTNKTIGGTFPPGSTFKVAVALAALESGAATPSTTVNCPGYLELGDTRFHCWKPSGHGLLDMHGGIKNSCDVYFYETARRTGVDRIADMARRLGMGQLTGIDLTGERPGLIPTRAWKRATLGQAWTQGETLVTGIGQGFVLTTPLQLALMLSRVVNGGKAVVPRIVRKPPEGDLIQASLAEGEPPPSLGISDASLQVLLSGMNAVVNEGGTAHGARITQPGMEMGGKSGTSQVRRITNAEREHKRRGPEDRPWRERDNALFIAYAPVQAPRYVCSIVIEHSGAGGSAAAAPIAHDLLIEAQTRDPLSGKPHEPVAGRVKPEVPS